VADRLVHVDVKFHLALTVPDGTTIEQVMQELEYEFSTDEPGVILHDSEMRDFNTTDAK
jgi:hypothetical protein